MGPGASGTTFIWAVLREMGYTTEPPGVDRPTYEILRYPDIMERINSGELEWPQVIKHCGGFCYNLIDHIDKYNWDVAHVFFCLRKINSLVTKKLLGRRKHPPGPKLLQVSSDEFKRMSRKDQENRLRELLNQEVGAGLFNLMERDIPFTVVRHPKAVVDFRYFMQKMDNIPWPDNWVYEDMKAAWERARTSWGAKIKPENYAEEGIEPEPHIKEFWENEKS